MMSNGESKAKSQWCNPHGYHIRTNTATNIVSNRPRTRKVMFLRTWLSRATLRNPTLGLLPITSEDQSEFRFLADLRSVPVEDVDGDNEANGEETEECGGPFEWIGVAHVFVHCFVSIDIFYKGKGKEGGNAYLVLNTWQQCQQGNLWLGHYHLLLRLNTVRRRRPYSRLLPCKWHTVCC